MKRARLHLLAAILLGLAATVPVAASPQASGDTLKSDTASPRGAPLQAADLQAFSDGFFPYALSRGDVAGAVVAVVANGRILFEKGYGLSDIAARRPVNPKTTLFRLGSTSKVLTWTAVMQLVESGKLDLDRDVNAYLDFKIPPRFGKPITLRNLMTHTAGFEESFKQLMSPDKASTPSLESYVKAHLPTRIYPPGQVIAYSNYGATLAGYIMQRVSGEPFEVYVKRHIFGPLAMEHSTFEQPVPQPLQVATGYKRASEGPYPFEYASDVPAGALSSTADDMARFMIAHLQSGQLGAVRILKPSTVLQMHTVQFRPFAPLPGMALGFYGEDRNGEKIIGHAGDLISFHADLHLMPKAGVGVFIAMNSWGANNASTSIRTAFFRAFLDRYFPAPKQNERPYASARADGKLISGRYSNSRQSTDNFASLATLLSQGVLTLNADNTINFSAFRDEQGVPKRWREIAPFVWRQIDGQSRIVAIVERGKVRAIATDDSPLVEEYLPTPNQISAAWNVPLILFALFIFTIALIVWICRAFGWLGQNRWANSVHSSRTGFVVKLAVAADWLFLMGWIYVLIASAENPVMLGPRLDPWLRLIQLCGVVGAAGIPFVVFSNVAAWRDDAIPLSVRCGRILLLFAAAGTLWFGLAFHLFDIHLTY